jgi:hypothetical protein
VRLQGKVVRCTKRDSRMFEIGVEFCVDTSWHDRQLVNSYVDHLREHEVWI